MWGCTAVEPCQLLKLRMATWLESNHFESPGRELQVFFFVDLGMFTLILTVQSRDHSTPEPLWGLPCSLCARLPSEILKKGSA